MHDARRHGRHMTWITAHAGSENTIPHTMESLTTALACGADCLELDVRCNEGAVVLAHDPIPAKAGALLRLENVLRNLGGTGVLFNCDLKETDAFEPTLRLFCDANLEEQLIFTGGYPHGYRRCGTRYRVFVNAEHLLGHEEEITVSQAHSLADWFFSRDADEAVAGLNVDYTTLDVDSLSVFKNRSVPLACWTVNNSAALKTLLCAEVCSITTHNVRKAADLRNCLQSSTPFEHLLPNSHGA